MTDKRAKHQRRNGKIPFVQDAQIIEGRYRYDENTWRKKLQPRNVQA